MTFLRQERTRGRFSFGTLHTIRAPGRQPAPGRKACTLRLCRRSGQRAVFDGWVVRHRGGSAVSAWAGRDRPVIVTRGLSVACVRACVSKRSSEARPAAALGQREAAFPGSERYRSCPSMTGCTSRWPPWQSSSSTAIGRCALIRAGGAWRTVGADLAPSTPERFTRSPSPTPPLAPGTQPGTCSDGPSGPRPRARAPQDHGIHRSGSTPLIPSWRWRGLVPPRAGRGCSCRDWGAAASVHGVNGGQAQLLLGSTRAVSETA
jgi:hypothetical protein